MKIDKFIEKSGDIISTQNIGHVFGSADWEMLLHQLDEFISASTKKLAEMGEEANLSAVLSFLERVVRAITEHLESWQHVGFDKIDWRVVLDSIDATITYIIGKLPDWEMKALEIFDLLFAPKQWLRQLALVVSIELMIVAARGVGKLAGIVNALISDNAQKQKEVLSAMANALNYSEWKALADKLDVLRGFDKWKFRDESSLFDHRVLKKRIHDTEEMIRHGGVFNLIFRLRGGLARDQFGMQHEGLFLRAMGGTKAIVEKYHDTMSRALNFICDSQLDEEDIPTDAKLAFFNETRHAYGRTALLLSGGAYMGYYHFGLGKALFAEGLMPRVISGASAGSLMAASIGTRTDEEVLDIWMNPHVEKQLQMRRDYFKLSTELKSRVGRQIQSIIPQALRFIFDPLLSMIFEGKLINLDTEHFKRVVRDNTGDYTFQEAFDRTGRIINITVAPMNDYEPPRLLNYLTAPHVCVWSAAAASCAIPGMFDSITLIVKEPNGRFRAENEWTRQAHLESSSLHASASGGVKYTDGSIENDLPMQQLSELFNVNHFIVSQVNAHSALLTSMALRTHVWSSPWFGVFVGCVRFVKAQVKDWIKNMVNLLNFSVDRPSYSAKRGIGAFLSQDYEGREIDININPWINHISLFTALGSIIKNPRDDEYLEVVKAGERATWPYICRIRAHCHVEITLDQCVQRLRKRIAIEEAVNEARRITADMKTGINFSKPGNGVHVNRDRTPSFAQYTTRTIINLSGLSVSDPLPLALPHGHSVPSDGSLSARSNSTSHGSQLIAINEENNNNNGSRSSSNSNNNRGPSGGSASAMYDGDYDASSPQDNAHHSRRSLSRNNTEHSSGLFMDDDGGAVGLLPHQSSQQQQQPSSPTSQSRVGAAAAAAAFSANVFPGAGSKFGSMTALVSGSGSGSGSASSGTVSGSDSHKSLGIHKTTSMANFYYKKSASGEFQDHE